LKLYKKNQKQDEKYQNYKTGRSDIMLYIFGAGGGALHILEDGKWYDSKGKNFSIGSKQITFIVDDLYCKGTDVKIYGENYSIKPYSEFLVRLKTLPHSYGHISSFDMIYKQKVAGNIGDQLKWLNSYSENFRMFRNINIGIGVRISSYCHIDSEVSIGNFVKLNSFAFIGHDSVVGDYSYISQHVILDNHASIGKMCNIFEGSIIMPNVHIGDNSIIGAGSVVTKDIPDNVVAYGSPAKVIRENK
jgi:acetyltransferase-like isoleucine patch superfamily enzyme